MNPAFSSSFWIASTKRRRQGTKRRTKGQDPTALQDDLAGVSGVDGSLPSNPLASCKRRLHEVLPVGKLPHPDKITVAGLGMPPLQSMLIITRAVTTRVIAGALLLTAPVAPAANVSSLGSPFLVKAWTTRDGLPQSSVIALTQRRDGYLWVGTWDGLARFDGLNFTVFDESNTPGLPDSSIVYLFEDSRTNLWVGTEAADVLLIRGGQVVPLDIGSRQRADQLVSATEDEQGAVWLYTAGGWLYRYFHGRMSDGQPVGAGYTNSPSRTVIAEQGGNVWVGMITNQFGIREPEAGNLTSLRLGPDLAARRLDFLLASKTGGYWRIADGRVQKWKGTEQIEDFGEYAWGDSLVSAACEDANGHLIVGTRGSGLFWYDTEGNPIQVSGLSADTILSLTFDREGDLWVGTDGGGLNRVRRRAFRTLPGTEDWVVQSVSADAQGGLWIGCNGGQLAYWSNGELRQYSTPDNPTIKAVAVDSEQNVWVGTWGRGLFQLEGDGFRPVLPAALFQSAVVAIHEAPSGALWLGMQEGLARMIDETPLRLFRTSDGLTDNAIRALANDPNGLLWIGTARGGLNRLKDGRFTAYRKSPGGLPSDDINALHIDTEDVLWIATGGGGLVRFNQGQWKTISKRDGLPSNSVGYLMEDPLGFLWIGSNAGLLRIAKSALNTYMAGGTNALFVRVFDEADGLPTRECTFRSQPAACATPDGRLWFPTIGGLVTVDPSELKPNPVPPPVAIESIRIDQKEQLTNLLNTAWPEHVTLDPGNRLLEVLYTSLNLGSRDRTRFRYRLEGHDPTWVDAGSDQIARYPQLPPGDYTFRVIAANEDGLWNREGATLAVRVLPPFWRTWLFMVTSGAILIALLAGSVYYISTQRLQRQVAMLRQKEALEKERARIARDLHDQLGANLTQVSLLGELVEADKNEPREVEDHAKQICETARTTTHALDEIVWAANPSNDTLESLINYVCKYAQEYLALAGLRYRLDVPSPLPAVTLPPELRHNVFLAAKEAVNNIVKHAQATEARITLKLETSRFTLEIADDGRGPGGTETKAAKSRNGLRNMRKRMSDIGGTFLIDPASTKGTVVRLTAPLRNAETLRLK